MKRLISILCFASSLGLFAQDCELPNAISNSTGVNMTVLLNYTFLNTITANSDLPYIVAETEDGLVVGVAYIAPDSLNNQSQSIAIWGDDTVTPEIDGATEGEQITLHLIDSLNYYNILSLGVLNTSTTIISSSLVYTANGIYVVQSGEAIYDCTGIKVGCTDEDACNYNPEAMQDDDSCEYPELYYDCLGICINDIDMNGICDELEGCMDTLACNYSMDVVVDDESCEYLEVTLTYDASLNSISTVIQGGTGSIYFYNWYLNGELIQGAEASTYSPLENGEYTLTITTANVDNPDIDDWCVGEDIIEITGLSLLEEGVGLRVYPNPVKDFLRIQWTAAQLNHITVYSVLGVKVFETLVDQAQEELFIPTQDWNNGMYFISLKYIDKVETKAVQILH